MKELSKERGFCPKTLSGKWSRSKTRTLYSLNTYTGYEKFPIRPLQTGHVRKRSRLLTGGLHSSVARMSRCLSMIDRKHKIDGRYLSKANGKVFFEGFSPFYTSPVLPLLIRDALVQAKAPNALKQRERDIRNAQLYYKEKEGRRSDSIHSRAFAEPSDGGRAV